MRTKIVLALSLVSSLAACTQIPKEAYFTRGQPESLLSVSSEQLTVDLRQRNGITQLTDAVNKNQPSNAELVCSTPALCSRAAEVLGQFNVPYNQTSGSANTVTLNYKSIVARDCDNHYIDNHNNPYNLNHPTYGCSIAVNQVQMVSDKREFVDPLLLGDYDGMKATQNYDSYISRTAVPLLPISTSTSSSH